MGFVNIILNFNFIKTLDLNWKKKWFQMNLFLCKSFNMSYSVSIMFDYSRYLTIFNLELKLNSVVGKYVKLFYNNSYNRLT